MRRTAHFELEALFRMLFIVGVATIAAVGQPAQGQRFPPNKAPQLEVAAHPKSVVFKNVQAPGHLALNLTLRSGEVKQADIYIQLHTGLNGADRVGLTSDGQFAKQMRPYAANTAIKDETRSVQVTVPTLLMTGPHTITAMLVTVGSDPGVGSNVLAEATTGFTVEPADTEPLEVSEQGNFFISKAPFPQRELFAWERMYILPYGVGNLYVGYRVPLRRTQIYPLVFIHGEAVTGAVFEYADQNGGEGWATYFQRRGFPVFVVDWPSVGRSAFGGKQNHEKNVTNEKIADDVVELLDRIGPAILVTKSWAGTIGWKVADMRPYLVRGIVALSPRVLGGKLAYRLPGSTEGGSTQSFYPRDSAQVEPGGNPDFRRDYITNAPEINVQEWLELLNPGWYEKTIAGEGLYTYVDGPGRVPIPAAMRDSLRVSLTPIGSPARPTSDVTFTKTKILVLIGEADFSKSLQYGDNLVGALQRAGVKDAEFQPLDKSNGFQGQGFQLEDGLNSERIADLVFDWMLRKQLAVGR